MVAVGATHVRRLAVIAAACIVAMTISCTSPATKPVTPESSEPRPKPDLTRVTTSMFVDRSAIPNSSAMEFGAPEISSDMQEPEGPVDPPECEPIFAGPRPTQAGSVSWSSTKPAGTSTNSEGRFFHLFLIVPAERPDLRSLLGKCGTVEYQGITTRISALPMPGCPVGLSQRASLCTELTALRPELTAQGSSAFAVVFTFPCPSLKSPSATFHRTTEMLW